MLIHIDVDKSERNKGTGTFVMNRLYDISEDINVPIYLIPYPAGHFNSKTEKDVVTILKNWYEKLGFGPVSDGSKVWCNFE
jgi:GNAT superfamily N-acetyltransferase